MNLTDWQNLIGALGFPIVCCIAQFYIILRMNKSHNDTLSELKRTIDNNTQSIIDLSNTIRGANNGKE